MHIEIITNYRHVNIFNICVVCFYLLKEDDLLVSSATKTGTWTQLIRNATETAIQPSRQTERHSTRTLGQSVSYEVSVAHANSAVGTYLFCEAE